MTIKLTNPQGQTLHINAAGESGQDLPIFLAMKLGPHGVTVDVEEPAAKYGLTSGKRLLQAGSDKAPRPSLSPLGQVLFNLGITANRKDG